MSAWLCPILLWLVAASTSTYTWAGDVYLENQLLGTNAWWYEQSDTIPPIQGFTTSFSYSSTDTVSFKIRCARNITSFSIGIFRLGYYQGLGGRWVANISANAIGQPRCLFEKQTRMTDCSNWQVNAEWNIPKDAVSGVYIALPTAVSGAGTGSTSYGSYIPFVVRSPPSRLNSSILFKTADLTWVAYNKFGNWNLYRGNGSFHPSSRATQASYNRPWQNRHLPPEGHFINFIFGAEFPMLYWLEKHGYDISYCSCADIENMHRAGQLVPPGDNRSPPVKAILSVGHDEYWTPGMKEAHEHARNYGVHLAFFSGNEVYWRTKWLEDVLNTTTATSASAHKGRKGMGFDELDSPHSGVSTMLDESTGRRVTLDPQRVIVCRKETLDNIPAIPSEDWTGTFRDPRHRQPDDEALLTGQRFMVNAHRKDAMTVTMEDARMRLWRGASFYHGATSDGKKAVPADCAVEETNVNVALQAHHAHITAAGVLGYEWDAFPMRGPRPAGLIPLSTTTVHLERHLVQDFGAAYNGSGVVVHRLSMYRHVTYHEDRESVQSNHRSDPKQLLELCTAESEKRRIRSTALVFGAGTVQWSWALSSWHDGYEVAPDRDLEQATINLFADMGVFPSSLQRSSASSDPCTAPLVRAAASTDTVPPESTITHVELRTHRVRLGPRANPLLNATLLPLQPVQVLRVRGEARDLGGGQVAAVEVSVDGGMTWQLAMGRTAWVHMHHFPPGHRVPPRWTSRLGQVGDNKSRLHVLREAMAREGVLYSSGPLKANLSLVVLARAVDDSGWMEKASSLHGLCAVKDITVSSTDGDGFAEGVETAGPIRSARSIAANIVLLKL